MTKLTAKQEQFIVFLFIFLFIIGARIYPFIKYGEAALGYDTGFYRRYLDIKTDNFFKPPASILESGALGPRFVLSLLSALNIDTNFALYGSHILFSLLIGLMIYFSASLVFKNRNAGFFAIGLYALSSVQWIAYTFMFYKQGLAVFFLLLALYLFEKKSSLFILPLFLSLISHRTTAFLTIPVFIIIAAVNILKKQKNILWFLTIFAAGFAAWLHRESIIQLFIFLQNGPPEQDPFKLKTGIFIDIKQYLHLSAFYFIPALLGWWLMIKKRIFNAFFLFFSLTILMVFTKSYFYQRIIFFLDIFAIILAGGAINYFYNRFKETKLTLLFILSGFILVGSVLFLEIKNYQPLITRDDLGEIYKLRVSENEAFILTESPEYAPWLYGWAGSDKKIIAPGLFWDKWTLPQWQEFWDGDEEKQKELLALYDEPIYIFMPESDYSKDDCFSRFSEFIWKFDCR